MNPEIKRALGVVLGACLIGFEIIQLARHVVDVLDELDGPGSWITFEADELEPPCWSDAGDPLCGAARVDDDGNDTPRWLTEDGERTFHPLRVTLTNKPGEDCCDVCGLPPFHPIHRGE